MQVGDRIQLTTDIRYLFSRHTKGAHGVIRKTSPWGGLHTLRMDDGRTQFAHTHEITPSPPRTGPEFARQHGNDSSTWTPADFVSVQTLAAMDVHVAWRTLHPTPTTDTATTAPPGRTRPCSPQCRTRPSRRPGRHGLSCSP
jgi:hypothetical protein